MTTSSEPRWQNCPSCGASIPVYAGYLPWCEQCEWNQKPEQEASPNLYERIYDRIGQQRSQSLFDQLRHAESLQAQLTLSKLLAYGIAVGVYACIFAFAVLGIWLIVVNWPNIVGGIVGALFLLLAWVARPRFDHMPTQIAPMSDLPSLYELTNRIACTIGAPPVDAIRIDASFNASFAQIGVKRTRVLSLGLPLWTLLTDQERIALLGHELGHCVNGDPNRGLIVGSAINTLASWSELLHPGPAASSAIGILLLPFTLLMIGVAKGVRLLFYALIHLLWQDSQRAEYLADHLGATVGGSNSMLLLLNQLALSATFWNTLQRTSLAGAGQELDFFQELRHQMEIVPLRERERIKRVTLKEESRLDATHPPTVYRIEMLKIHPVATGQVILSSELSERIENELIPVRRRVQKELVDLYRQSIYY